MRSTKVIPLSSQTLVVLARKKPSPTIERELHCGYPLQRNSVDISPVVGRTGYVVTSSSDSRRTDLE